jgi:hypothetical protein
MLRDEGCHGLRKIRFVMGYHLTQLIIRAFAAQNFVLRSFRGTTEGLLIEDALVDEIGRSIDQAADEGKA